MQQSTSFLCKFQFFLSRAAFGQLQSFEHWNLHFCVKFNSIMFNFFGFRFHSKFTNFYTCVISLRKLNKPAQTVIKLDQIAGTLAGKLTPNLKFLWVRGFACILAWNQSGSSLVICHFLSRNLMQKEEKS